MSGRISLYTVGCNVSHPLFVSRVTSGITKPIPMERYHGQISHAASRVKNNGLYFVNFVFITSNLLYLFFVYSLSSLIIYLCYYLLYLLICIIFIYYFILFSLFARLLLLLTYSIRYICLSIVTHSDEHPIGL